MPPTEQARWFSEHVLPYEPALRAYLHRRFPTLPDHDDLVQETYVRMLREKDAGRLMHERAFLFTAARNAAIDLFRRHRTTPLETLDETGCPLELLEAAPGIIDAIEREQRLESLLEAIVALPERCRQVMMLRHLDGFSYKEIAARLEISPETVKVHMIKGVKDCTRFLQQRGLLGAKRDEGADREMNTLPDDDDAIDTAAAAWLCERDEGFAPGRAAAFAAWVAVDPRHSDAVARVEQTLALMDDLPSLRDRLEKKLAASPPLTPNLSQQWWQRPALQWGGLAAALTLGGALWLFVPGRAPTVEYFTATATAPREVALRDGSVMNVNQESDVAVQLSAAERRVTLARGEAHFAVAADTARPFIVTAGDVAVRAVGTAFSVRLGETGVEVLVTEGKVQVERIGATGSSALAAAGDSTHRGQRTAPRVILLAAHERTVVARASTEPPVIEAASPAAIRAALAWHPRTTTFSDVPLRDVLARFNARNVTQLVLADAELGTRRIGGTFALDQPDAFARLLAHDGDVALERHAENEIVLRRVR